MQFFSANAIVFSKKKKKIFDPENLKKTPSTVAHNRPPTFFLVLPTGPNPAQISTPAEGLLSSIVTLHKHLISAQTSAARKKSNVP